jgi:hypothetical protein
MKGKIGNSRGEKKNTWGAGRQNIMRIFVDAPITTLIPFFFILGINKS